MEIKRSIERVPGGMMTVPLFTGAIVNTLAPNVAKTFGSFTGALFTGALPDYGPAADAATVLVATSVVVTAICVPLVTAWWHRRLGRRTPPPARAIPAASTR